MNLWEQTIQSLQTTLSPYDFMHWIRPVQCHTIDDERSEIVLSVPDDSHARWVEDHFLQEIRRILKEITSTGYQVTFRSMAEDLPSSNTAATSPLEVSESLPDAPRPNLVERYRFDAFIDGANSRFALNAAQAVADQPGCRYNPLFLYGGVGLGKTHLLHAIGHEVLGRKPSTRILYVTSETYVNDLIGAIRTHTMDQFRTRYRDACDILLIDDIQFIAGKDRTQEEFFHMFNTLHSSHKQIVLTCDQMPGSIPNLEERLRSRLQWGLIADIKPPGFETRVAILKGKSETDGFPLPDDVAMFLARHITRNVRELEGALMRIEAQARIFGVSINIDLAKNVLEDLVDLGPKHVSHEAILKAVSHTYQVTTNELKGPRRHRHITLPRQISMYLLRELTDASLAHIGSIFGGRDHSTVINAIKRIERLIEVDMNLKELVGNLKQELSN